MTTYILSLEDYKEYFKKNTKYKKDFQDWITLEIEPIDNKDDKEWEYSIKWTNWDNDEYGYIYNINTSSIFSLKSCSWIDYTNYLESDDEKC